MEDFIEIIFYVVILVLSGIGSLLKNSKKQEKKMPTSEPEVELRSDETVLEDDVLVTDGSRELDKNENELVSMLRKVAAEAEAKQREKEKLEQLQCEEELRQKEFAERCKKAEFLYLEKGKNFVKQQPKQQNENLEVDNDEDNSVLGLNLFDINEARSAFIASEILTKKHF